MPHESWTGDGDEDERFCSDPVAWVQYGRLSDGTPTSYYQCEHGQYGSLRLARAAHRNAKSRPGLANTGEGGEAGAV